jgi:drug/metabolite transporter (DMT)-like permease
LTVEKPLITLTLSLAIGLIWSGWVVVSAQGQAAGLTPFDLTLFRYAVPAVFALPWFIRSPAARDWRKLLVVGAVIGVPHALLVQFGLEQAGPAHAGVILPGMVPLFTVLLAWVGLRHRPSTAAVMGLLCILGGVFLIVLSDAGSLADFAPIWPGDALFVLAASLWAVFTIAITAWKLKPMETVAIVSVVSTIIYLPIYVIWLPKALDVPPVSEFIFQFFAQGFLGILVAMAFYALVVQLAGPQRAATITATVPVLTLLLTWLLLNETPTWLQWAGAFVASAGIWLLVTQGSQPTTMRPARVAQHE